MITLQELEGVKLVQVDNFDNEADVSAALEYSFQQGSQGWGVTAPTSILLSVALQLRTTTTEAAGADEARRSLAGARLELGRVKKQRDTLKAAVDSLTQTVGERTASINTMGDKIDELHAENVSLRAELADKA